MSGPFLTMYVNGGNFAHIKYGTLRKKCAASSSKGLMYGMRQFELLSKNIFEIPLYSRFNSEAIKKTYHTVRFNLFITFLINYKSHFISRYID